MNQFRKTIFWLHLIAGVVAGLFILLMSLTGVLLTYERQMLEQATTPAVAPLEGSRLALDQLVDKAQSAAPAGTTLTALTLHRDAAMPVQASFGREATLWLHPQSGGKLDAGSPWLRSFFRTVTDLHRWLALTGDWRSLGKSLTGASNLVFLFLVVSGLYLWFPRQWRWPAFRPVLWFRRGLKGKARDWNWHNVLGFWACIPLFFIVVTGALISYPWATALLYRALGESPPAAAGPRAAGSRPAERPASAAPASAPAALAKLQAAAEASFPQWQTITLTLPVAKTAAFTVTEGHRGRPDLRSSLTLDPATGSVLTTERFSDFSTARQARTWGRWIHTGEAGGFWGQTLAGLASLAAVLLVWTGFALTWRRLRRAKP